jgi:predicted nucleotidyltransferase
VGIKELKYPSDRCKFSSVITQRQIETYAKDVARQFRPLKIVLFGSYAYGNPTEDSDVDLMVVMPKDPSGIRNRDKAIAIDSAIPAAFPLDLLVRNPEDIAWRLEEGDCFLQDVFSKGRVLYEASDR